MSTTAAIIPPPPAPLIDEDSRGFWEATREGRIALCRCTECGSWLGRPLERCHVCAGPTAFADVAGTGTIYTFIVVHRPVIPAYADLVPYVIAVVELDEGPRLPGILLGENGAGVAIGQPVRAELSAVPGTEERAVAFRRS
ncbi:Zn-ribbon domain-containing OB-fold protein [Nocardioides sp. cx-173]|uniref:Zn-ribbon domain-containing OB-fold protein n=1 Tax=Nocardioides sp. cx-173 TaxID=2898796 RepID=UPI001E300585|nr:OB-fold domain-containing protein [Nocardioides sp. cx-173]MCD4524245.1 OB-fold domain-containing protein [Nocardioides sp. cx-173]UGB41637.1 OB-fold domain-containing protein [Nocardioides sp. cx-173]